MDLVHSNISSNSIMGSILVTGDWRCLRGRLKEDSSAERAQCFLKGPMGKNQVVLELWRSVMQ